MEHPHSIVVSDLIFRRFMDFISKYRKTVMCPVEKWLKRRCCKLLWLFQKNTFILKQSLMVKMKLSVIPYRVLLITKSFVVQNFVWDQPKHDYNSNKKTQILMFIYSLFFLYNAITWTFVNFEKSRKCYLMETSTEHLKPCIIFFIELSNKF